MDTCLLSPPAAIQPVLLPLQRECYHHGRDKEQALDPPFIEALGARPAHGEGKGCDVERAENPERNPSAARGGGAEEHELRGHAAGGGGKRPDEPPRAEEANLRGETDHAG